MTTYVIDTETTGLDPKQDKLKWITVYEVGKSIYHLDHLTWNFVGSLKEEATILYHNAPFDLAFMQEALGGVHSHRIRDTKVLAHLLGEPSTSLGDLLAREFNVNIPKVFKRRDWDNTTQEDFEYMVNDVLYLPRLHAHLYQCLIKEDVKLVHKYEQIMTQMELYFNSGQTLVPSDLLLPYLSYYK